MTTRDKIQRWIDLQFTDMPMSAMLALSLVVFSLSFVLFDILSFFIGVSLIVEISVSVILSGLFYLFLENMRLTETSKAKYIKKIARHYHVSYNCVTIHGDNIFIIQAAKNRILVKNMYNDTTEIIRG